MSIESNVTPEEITFLEAWGLLKTFTWENSEIEEMISNLGTSLPDYFRQKRRGGLDVQQIPSELAKLIRYFWKYHPQMASYLEVGIGKGGTFTVLNESWRARNIHPELFVADSFCYATKEQETSFDWLRQQYEVTAYLGDTAQKGFIDFLETKQFEVIFVDGDHSFEGCLRDFLATYPRLESSGSMVFHDIASTACVGVGEVFEFARRFFEHSEVFIDSTSCGIGVLRCPSLTRIPKGAVRRFVFCHHIRRVWKEGRRLFNGMLRRISRG